MKTQGNRFAKSFGLGILVMCLLHVGIFLASANAADFPQKGKVITLIIPWGAGGGSDVGARLLTPLMEKDLKTTINVVNKTGGSSQVGITALTRAKPDGYTFGMTNLPATAAIYLDADRQAAFERKDLQPICTHVFDPTAIAVSKDSPFKTFKEFMDAAKANPGKLTIGTSGFMSASHVAFLTLQKNTGVRFSFVPFNSDGQLRGALLGGHVNAEAGSAGELAPALKSGDIRVLAVFDETPYPFLPGVPTALSQGFNITFATVRAFSAPNGTPKEIISILGAAIKKAMFDPEHKKKMDAVGLGLRYMNADQFSAYWDQVDTSLAPIIKASKKK